MVYISAMVLTRRNLYREVTGIYKGEYSLRGGEGGGGRSLLGCVEEGSYRAVGGEAVFCY